MTETTAPPTVQPAFDPMLRKEQMSHMMHQHGVTMHQKILKPHLIEEHTIAHLCVDLAAGKPSEEEVFAFLVKHHITEYAYKMYSSPDRYVPHTHEVAPAAPVAATNDEVAAAHGQITKGEKPIAQLNAAERKALTALVDNDFAALTAEMRAFAADVKRTRREAAIAEFESKKADADKYHKRLAAASDKFAAACAKIKADAEADGFRVQNMPYRHGVGSTSFEVSALAEALSTINAEVDADLDRALSQARTSHLAAQRTILLTGVPEGVATQVLNSIPSAKEMMVQAAAQHDQPMPPQVDTPKTEFYISSV